MSQRGQPRTTNNLKADSLRRSMPEGSTLKNSGRQDLGGLTSRGAVGHTDIMLSQHRLNSMQASQRSIGYPQTTRHFQSAYQKKDGFKEQITSLKEKSSALRLNPLRQSMPTTPASAKKEGNLACNLLNRDSPSRLIHGARKPLNYNFSNQSLNKEIVNNATLFNQLTYKIKNDPSYVPKLEAMIDKIDEENRKLLEAQNDSIGNINRSMDNKSLNLQFSNVHPDVQDGTKKKKKENKFGMAFANALRRKANQKRNEKVKTQAMQHEETTDSLRVAMDAAEARKAADPGSWRPRLALAILKRCQKEFYSQIAANKYVMVPTGKAFEKSMQLKLPVISIIGTPVDNTVLGNRFFQKTATKQEEESILQQIANNRGSMLDMYATANALSLMHLKGKLPRPSDSILMQRKQYKKKKGQEEYEAHLWGLLQKACAIRDGLSRKREAKQAALEASAAQEEGYDLPDQTEDKFKKNSLLPRITLKAAELAQCELKTVHETGKTEQSQNSSEEEYDLDEADEKRIWDMPSIKTSKEQRRDGGEDEERMRLDWGDGADEDENECSEVYHKGKRLTKKEVKKMLDDQRKRQFAAVLQTVERNNLIKQVDAEVKRQALLDGITGLVVPRAKHMKSDFAKEVDDRKKVMEKRRARRKKRGLLDSDDESSPSSEEEVPEYKGKPKYLCTQIKEMINLRRTMKEKKINMQGKTIVYKPKVVKEEPEAK